jgi:hypothetical protein
MTPRAAALALALAACTGPTAARAGLPSPAAAVTVGSGGGGWSLGGSTAWFGDVLARDPLRLSLGVEGDVRVLGWLRGGVRSSTLYLGAGGEGTRTSLLISRLEAVATARPAWRWGPYARAGLGPALVRYAVRVPGLASGSVTSFGVGLSLAAGAYWALTDHLELRLEAETAAEAWRKKASGPSASWTFGGAAGAAWRW